MPAIVQKFGGTSLKDSRTRDLALGHILRAVQEGKGVVVVVSAMGRKPSPYATDTLIELLKAAGEPVSPRELDLMVSCGEVISTALIAHTLSSRGCPAIGLTGGQAGIITDGKYGQAEITEIKSEPILRHLREGKVVVVAGFQGVTRKGEITTLGRGGSDTSAVAIGAAISAEMVEIYTDVEGVAVVNPALVTEAPFLKEIDFNDMLQLATEGCRVVHPRAIKTALKGNLPLRVRSTFSQKEGTLVHKIPRSRKGDFPFIGIADQKELALLTFTPAEKDRKKTTSQIEQALTHFWHESLPPERMELSFLVREDIFYPSLLEALHRVGLPLKLRTGLAKLSLICHENPPPKLQSRLSALLKEHDLHPLRTITQPASVKLVLPQSSLKEAANLIYRKIFLE
ncbi:aspartate kinase [bacterium (candidate division B38) B3_B38]|nr:MAG: aspartate kinase [bacterium (candidate division B38) B3_B38]